MNLFSYLFLAALLAGLLLDYWLLLRQRRHVAAHADRVPEVFRKAVTPAQHRKAADYTLAKVRLALWELPLGPLLLLAWLGGGIEWLGRWLGDLGLEPLTTGTLLILSVILLSSLVELPSSLYRTFVLEERFGFNRTTPARFATDLLLQTLLMLVVGGALVFTMLWVVISLGSWWWIAGWLVWVAFSLSMMWLFPSVIAPLFNRFTPLADGPLKTRIQQLLDRCGFRSKGVFVMDGSRRSGHGNAYFTGFGRAKRIVFFDTLLQSLGDDELEAVLAHELGHFSHKHIRNMLVISSLLMLVGFFVVGWSMLQPWFFQGLGVQSDSKAMDLLVILLVLPIFSRFLQPLMSFYQRKNEFQADDFAVRQCGIDPLVTALVTLYRENAATLTPDPLYSAFHDSHPPAPVRIGRLINPAAPANDG